MSLYDNSSMTTVDINTHDDWHAAIDLSWTTYKGHRGVTYKLGANLVFTAQDSYWLKSQDTASAKGLLDVQYLLVGEGQTLDGNGHSITLPSTPSTPKSITTPVTLDPSGPSIRAWFWKGVVRLVGSPRFRACITRLSVVVGYLPAIITDNGGPEEYNGVLVGCTGAEYTAELVQCQILVQRCFTMLHFVPRMVHLL